MANHKAKLAFILQFCAEYQGAHGREACVHAAVLARIGTVCAPFKLSWESQGDPRGCVVRVHFPSGARNGWGDGWGVPT